MKAATEAGVQLFVSLIEFQSTPPVKAATHCGFLFLVCQSISIHAAREGGDSSGDAAPGSHDISIHAAREGGDFGVASVVKFVHISIHAAREGGDGRVAVKPAGKALFQSTPPVKAATYRPQSSFLR